jgi:hypothetical protein
VFKFFSAPAGLFVFREKPENRVNAVFPAITDLRVTRVFPA